MNSTTTLDCKVTAPPSELLDTESIRHAIEHAVHLLPAQGPITAFVHHNTLHAFEDLEFDAAVRTGAKVFGCHPYLPERQYREMLKTGRIREQDIEAVLIDQLGDRADDLLGFLGTRFGLYQAILHHSLHDGPSVDLKWVIGDTNALNQFRGDTAAETRRQFIDETRQWVMRDLRKSSQGGSGEMGGESGAKIPEALQQKFEQIFELFGIANIEKWSEETWESFVLHLLWKTCEHGARQTAGDNVRGAEAEFQRHRDLLLNLTCEDADERVNEILIPFCAAFLDQGFSNWPLEDREQGFYAAFFSLYGISDGIVEPWRRGLAAELQKLKAQSVSPVDSIRRSLAALGVLPDELETYVSDTLLALRGYAGMLWQLESRGDRVVRAVPGGTLVEFLAVRLILDRFATAAVAREFASYRGELLNSGTGLVRNWAAGRPRRPLASNEMRFGCLNSPNCLAGGPRHLAHNTPAEWQRIVSEVNQFSGIASSSDFSLGLRTKIPQRNAGCRWNSHRSRPSA